MIDKPAPKHVFVSYSRKDEAVMQRVARFLRKQGVILWVDNEKLIPGTATGKKEIEKAIKKAGAVVVLLSPASCNSIWVEREISFAESHDKKIFPILIDGNEKTAVPITLVNHQRIDIRQGEKTGLNTLNTTLTSYLEDLDIQERHVSEADERLAREKVKREQEELEQKEREERARREKAQHEAAEKAAREKANREATEKAAKEKAAREKAELRAAKWKAYHPRVLFSKVNLFFDTNLGHQTRSFLSSIQSLEITLAGVWRAIRTFLFSYICFDTLLELVGVFESINEGTTSYSIRGHWGWTVMEIVFGIVLGAFVGFWDADPEEDERLENDATVNHAWIQVASFVWGCIGFLFSGFITIGFSIQFLAKFNITENTYNALWILSLAPALFYGFFDGINWHNHARYYLKTKYPR